MRRRAGSKTEKTPGAAAGVKHREDLLDEALEESFPASDPPSITQPASGRP